MDPIFSIPAIIFGIPLILQGARVIASRIFPQAEESDVKSKGLFKRVAGSMRRAFDTSAVSRVLTVWKVISLVTLKSYFSVPIGIALFIALGPFGLIAWMTLAATVLAINLFTNVFLAVTAFSVIMTIVVLFSITRKLMKRSAASSSHTGLVKQAEKSSQLTSWMFTVLQIVVTTVVMPALCWFNGWKHGLSSYNTIMAATKNAQSVSGLFDVLTSAVKSELPTEGSTKEERARFTKVSSGDFLTFAELVELNKKPKKTNELAIAVVLSQSNILATMPSDENRATSMNKYFAMLMSCACPQLSSFDITPTVDFMRSNMPGYTADFSVYGPLATSICHRGAPYEPGQPVMSPISQTEPITVTVKNSALETVKLTRQDPIYVLSVCFPDAFASYYGVRKFNHSRPDGRPWSTPKTTSEQLKEMHAQAYRFIYDKTTVPLDLCVEFVMPFFYVSSDSLNGIDFSSKTVNLTTSLIPLGSYHAMFVHTKSTQTTAVDDFISTFEIHKVVLNQRMYPVDARFEKPLPSSAFSRTTDDAYQAALELVARHEASVKQAKRRQGIDTRSVDSSDSSSSSDDDDEAPALTKETLTHVDQKPDLTFGSQASDSDLPSGVTNQMKRDETVEIIVDEETYDDEVSYDSSTGAFFASVTGDVPELGAYTVRQTDPVDSATPGSIHKLVHSSITRLQNSSTRSKILLATLVVLGSIVALYFGLKKKKSGLKEKALKTAKMAHSGPIDQRNKNKKGEKGQKRHRGQYEIFDAIATKQLQDIFDAAESKANPQAYLESILNEDIMDELTDAFGNAGVSFAQGLRERGKMAFRINAARASYSDREREYNEDYRLHYMDDRGNQSTAPKQEDKKGKTAALASTAVSVGSQVVAQYLGQVKAAKGYTELDARLTATDERLEGYGNLREKIAKSINPQATININPDNVARAVFRLTTSTGVSAIGTRVGGEMYANMHFWKEVPANSVLTVDPLVPGLQNSFTVNTGKAFSVIPVGTADLGSYRIQWPSGYVCTSLTLKNDKPIGLVTPVIMPMNCDGKLTVATTHLIQDGKHFASTNNGESGTPLIDGMGLIVGFHKSGNENGTAPYGLAVTNNEWVKTRTGSHLQLTKGKSSAAVPAQ